MPLIAVAPVPMAVVKPAPREIETVAQISQRMRNPQPSLF